MSRFTALVVASLAALACSDATPTPPPPRADAAPRPVRPTTVHNLPPHAIRNDSVGPYVVGAPFYDVLHQLPDGPRIERLRLGESVDWSVARTEEGKILVGAGDASRVAYIAVLAAGIARTPEYGLEVGSTGAQLIKVLGAETTVDVVSDRRWYRFTIMPGVRFLTAAPPDTDPADARVVAILLTAADEAAESTSKRGAPAEGSIPQPRPPSPCRDAVPDVAADVIGAAKLRAVALQPKPEREPLVRWGCVTSSQREAVIVAGNELAVVGGEPGKWRRLAGFQIGPVDLAGPLDVDGDGRDEIVVGRIVRSEDSVAAEVQVLRWEVNHFVVALTQKPYVITGSVAAGAGMTLPQVELSIDVSAQSGALIIDGLYWATDRGRLHELAPLQRVEVKLGRKGAAGTPAVDAGPPATPTPVNQPDKIDAAPRATETPPGKETTPRSRSTTSRPPAAGCATRSSPRLAPTPRRSRASPETRSTSSSRTCR
jgi:hypothetical protein